MTLTVRVLRWLGALWCPWCDRVLMIRGHVVGNHRTCEAMEAIVNGHNLFTAARAGRISDGGSNGR